MSHKTAKKVRRLLKAIGHAGEPNTSAWQEREYTEDSSKRKKQLVELKAGGEQEIEVSMGQITLKKDSGRAVYKLVKRVMTGQGTLPTRSVLLPPPGIREVELWNTAVATQAPSTKPAAQEV